MKSCWNILIPWCGNSRDEVVCKMWDIYKFEPILDWHKLWYHMMCVQDVRCLWVWTTSRLVINYDTTWCFPKHLSQGIELSFLYNVLQKVKISFGCTSYFHTLLQEFHVGALKLNRTSFSSWICEHIKTHKPSDVPLGSSQDTNCNSSLW
jgi:hypothetical protein